MHFLFVVLLVTQTLADPVPAGGANCTDNFDCGGVYIGTCVNSKCQCSPRFAGINCSYERVSANVAGALNIALPFVGVCGVGNFIIGRTGPAIGQLLLTLSLYIILIPLCICGCCIAGCKGYKKLIFSTLGCILLCVAILAILAGFIWSIVDGALILQGKYTDGKGFDLYRS